MKPKNKLPKIKKDIKDFLLSEEGKMAKKDIAKIGISLAFLSMVFNPTQAAGHGSGLADDSSSGGHHYSHASHGSHGSHGSHCDGNSSWC